MIVKIPDKFFAPLAVVKNTFDEPSRTCRCEARDCDITAIKLRSKICILYLSCCQNDVSTIQTLHYDKLQDLSNFLAVINKNRHIQGVSVAK